MHVFSSPLGTSTEKFLTDYLHDHLYPKQAHKRPVYNERSFMISSFSSDGNSSLLNEGGSTLNVPQATVELVGYRSVVWPDSASEWLVDRAGLQQMLCCLIASTARALLCMADAQFRIQVIGEAVVDCPEPEHSHLFPSG